VKRGDMVLLSRDYDEWYRSKNGNAVTFGETDGEWRVRIVYADGSVTLVQCGAVRPHVPRRYVVGSKHNA
jgi:hypothetical protein